MSENQITKAKLTILNANGKSITLLVEYKDFSELVKKVKEVVGKDNKIRMEYLDKSKKWITFNNEKEFKEHVLNDSIKINGYHMHRAFFKKHNETLGTIPQNSFSFDAGFNSAPQTLFNFTPQNEHPFFDVGPTSQNTFSFRSGFGSGFFDTGCDSTDRGNSFKFL